MAYMIQSRETAEVYVSDGVNACGPLRANDRNSPLDDYHLDNPAPDWVAERDGKILREEG